jgi:hypothetical protein
MQVQGFVEQPDFSGVEPQLAALVGYQQGRLQSLHGHFHRQPARHA